MKTKHFQCIVKMELSGSDEEEVGSWRKRSKRGMSTSDQYRRNVIKKARVQGKEYVNYKNNQVNKVVIGPACNCKKKCYDKVAEEDRISIFGKFYDMSSKNEQDIYLQGLIDRHDVARRRPRQLSENRDHAFSYKYFLKTDSNPTKVEVCKKAFCNIHGITFERVRRLCNLLKENLVPFDKRGMGRSGNSVPGEICLQIEEHIKSFPVKIAHYSSKEYRYLSAELSVKKMWELFKEKHPSVKVTYEYYLKIFKERFELHIGRPQVDSCITCESLSIKSKSKELNDNAKKTYIAELIVHKRRANKFYKKIKEIEKLCQNEENTIGLCFDFMQNLQLPHIPVQDVFYLRQLTVSVFNIHNLKTNTSKFYVYHEGVAKKGANEVCSHLLDYINENIPANIKILYLFCDGCAGQNKNHTLIRLCSALVSLGKFEKIIQYFPQRGHSFLPCDRNFGAIKREIRKHDRIYTVSQYCHQIEIASKSHKFETKMVQTSDIISFKNWWPTYYKRSCLSDDSYGRNIKKEQKVTFHTQFMEFRHNIAFSGKVECLQFIDGFCSTKFTILRDRINLCLPLGNAYTDVVKINEKKITDIKKLEPYIPEDYMDFYNTIFSWPTTVAEEVEEL